MVAQSNGNNLVVQGRIIWSIGNNICEGKQKTKYGTNEIVLGVDGNPVIEYGFGLAIPKIDPATGQITAEYKQVWEALHKEAFTLYPNGQIPPGFAMKYKDGDTDVDENGKPYSSKEGYPGHIVLACTTQIPIKYFRFEGGNNILVNDGIKCGDYVNAQLNIKAHPAKGQGKPGLYLNPSAVQFIQAGKEIINAPSGDQIFGQGVPAYSGQVEAHVQPTMPNVAPGMQPPVNGAAMAPTPGIVPQSTIPAANPVNPHYGVIPQTHQPAAAPTPGMPPMGNVNVAPATPGLTNTVPQAMPGVAQPASHFNSQAPLGAPPIPGMPQ